MDFANVSNFLLPELLYCPVVVENESLFFPCDKIPLVDLNYILKGSPPVYACSEEEIEYVLNSENPKQKLIEIAKILVNNSTGL